MQQAFLSRVEEVLSRVEEVCGLRMHGGHRRRSIYYVCEEYRRPADLRLQDHPRTVYLREDVAVSKVVEFLQTHVFGPQRRELLRRALEASDPEAEERGDEIERLRRLVDELSLRIRRQMANLEIEEPGSEAAGEIRARLRELAAMKARRQRELEAAERAGIGQPDPDTATTLLDLLPCLQVSAELLREESFRELLEALHFDARFDPQRKALGIRVVLHPDLLTPPERPQTSPLLSVPPAGIEPATHGLGNRCSIH